LPKKWNTKQRAFIAAPRNLHTTTPFAIFYASSPLRKNKHEELAHELGEKLTPEVRKSEDQTARRMFVLLIHSLDSIQRCQAAVKGSSIFGSP
jgi:hypothetical protein